VFQVALAVELDVAAAQRDGDVAAFAAVDLRRRHRLHVVDGLADARTQVVQRHFGVVPLRDLDAGQARHAALGAVAGDLDLLH
jgi:hypothetical protein